MRIPLGRYRWTACLAWQLLRAGLPGSISMGIRDTTPDGAEWATHESTGLRYLRVGRRRP